MREIVLGLIRWLLVQLGKLLEALSPGEPAARLSFFFATPAIGGAERVHADIVAALADHKPEVFFTEPAPNTGLLPLYVRAAKVTDLAPRLARRAGFYLTVGRVAARINRVPGAVAFGAFSYFFYRLLPHLAARVHCVDLLHNFGVRFEHFSLPYVGRLDKRVVITAAVADALKALYRKHGVAEALDSRVTLIENAVAVPDTPPAKRQSGPLRVLFVGRATPEKRVYLVGRLASACAREGVAARFILAGDTAGAIAPDDQRHVRRVGAVTDWRKLSRLYARAHVLVLTSSREGFPVAVMEAMAHGVAPLCTDVGGLRTHVLEGQTGALVAAAPDEEVISAMLGQLRRWDADRGGLARLGAAAYNRAKTQFSRERFTSAYREMLLPRAQAPAACAPALVEETAA